MVRHLFTAVFVLMGMYAIAAQVYFIRELLILFYGNELCLGIIFAAWFAGIGCGAACGGRALRRAERVVPGFLLALALYGLLPFALVPFMRMLRAVSSVPPGGLASLAQIAAGACASVSPFGFMVGLLFPLACRALMLQGEQGSSAIRSVYVWESLGSLAGGLAISFWLLPAQPVLLVFGCGSLLLLGMAFVLSCTMHRQGLAMLLGILLAANVIALIGGLLPKLDQQLVTARWKTFGNQLRLVASRDSRYQNVALAESQGQYSLFANGSLIGTYPDPYQYAVKAHLFMSQHQAPQHVLLIGGGVFGLLEEVLAYPVLSIDYVELDPLVIQMMRPLLTAAGATALADPRVRLLHADGRRFVNTTTEQYDLIIVDAPDPSTALLNRYYTVEFFRAARRLLSPGGVMVTGLSATPNYLGSEIADYNGSLYQSLSSVFPAVMVVPGVRNYFFAAQHAGILSDDPAVLAERFERQVNSSRHFSAALFRSLVEKERIDFLGNALSQYPARALNSDSRPITCFYNLVIWDMLAGARGGRHVVGMLQNEGLVLAAVLVCVAVLAGAAALAARRSARPLRPACLWIIGTTGCASMAIEIVLIFMFQSLYGYVYERIGIIVALFMLGLALGGLAVRRRVHGPVRASVKDMLALEALLGTFIMAVAVLTGPSVAALADRIGGFALLEILYYCMILTAGLLAGMEFPLVSHALICSGDESGRAAGWVDAVDHVGAGCGALLTGTLCMPLLGAQTTCLIMVGLKVTGAALLAMSAGQGAFRKREG